MPSLTLKMRVIERQVVVAVFHRIRSWAGQRRNRDDAAVTVKLHLRGTDRVVIETY